MGRTQKITTNPSDRKDQRDRTSALIEATQGMELLKTEPPENLAGIAKKAWETIVPILNSSGFVKSSDSSVVELLCINVELYRLAYESIKEDGIQSPIYKTSLSPLTGEIVARDFTGFKRNPATQIIDSATAKINSLSGLLGLNPASRQTLLAIVDDKEDEQSLGDLLKGGDEF